MSHTTTIQSATFAGTTLASVLLVRIARRAAIKQQAGDTDAFVTSVQPAATQIEAELRTPRRVEFIAAILLGRHENALLGALADQVRRIRLRLDGWAGIRAVGRVVDRAGRNGIHNVQNEALRYVAPLLAELRGRLVLAVDPGAAVREPVF